MNRRPSYIPLKTRLSVGRRRGLQNLLIKLYDFFDKKGEYERGI